MFFPNLMGPELHIPTINSDFTQHTPPQAPIDNTGREPGDYRSAEQITSGPLFKNLFKDPKSKTSQAPLLEGPRVDDFFWQIGGNWNDPKRSFAERADIAANAERVLKFIDQTGGESSTANNGVVEGTINLRPRLQYEVLSPDDINIEGSEARKLLNFAKYGYSALQHPNNGDIAPTRRPVEQRVPPEKPPANAETDTSVFPTREERRPVGDTRTAMAIYNQSEAVQFFIGTDHLTPQNEDAREKLLDRLKDVVGNFSSNHPDKEAQADAMFRLARVAEFIMAKSDGVEETAKELFAAFSQTGYAALSEDSLASTKTPHIVNKPTRPEGRPVGDLRTADQILSENKPLTEFVQQLEGKRYGEAVISGLKTQVGDWTLNNSDPEKRANAAYNLAQVANYVMDHVVDEQAYNGFKNNGPRRISGLSDTSPPSVKTQAGVLMVFSHKGYAALPG